MNLKLAFLNTFMKDKVYVEKLPKFQNIEYPNHIFRLKKKILIWVETSS